MQVLEFDYQRNGVSGDDFYYMLVKDLPKCPEGCYLVSFEMDPETENDGILIDTASVRVVKIDDFYANWRGDNIGGYIQQAFENTHFKTYYEWMQSIRQNKRNETIPINNN